MGTFSFHFLDTIRCIKEAVRQALHLLREIMAFPYTGLIRSNAYRFSLSLRAVPTTNRSITSATLVFSCGLCHYVYFKTSDFNILFGGGENNLAGCREIAFRLKYTR